MAIIFYSAIEDIPQILIGIIVYGINTFAAVVCFSVSVFLIVWKMIRLFMNGNGRGTGGTMTDEAILKDIEQILAAKANINKNDNFNRKGDGNATPQRQEMNVLHVKPTHGALPSGSFGTQDASVNGNDTIIIFINQSIAICIVMKRKVELRCLIN